MSYKTSSIPNIRTIKALRGESLTIDLGEAQLGTLQAWMKKDPDDTTFRSFSITSNRYLVLSKAKASDYTDVNGKVTEAVDGKWYFDVEQILDPLKPEEVKTIFRGTILFQKDITGGVGVEVTNPITGLTFAQLEDTPNTYTNNANKILKVNSGETALEYVTDEVKAIDNIASASSTNVGTIRYRSDANNSYLDMSMQIGVATYAWVNIKTNTW